MGNNHFACIRPGPSRVSRLFAITTGIRGCQRTAKMENREKVRALLNSVESGDFRPGQGVHLIRRIHPAQSRGPRMAARTRGADGANTQRINQ